MKVTESDRRIDFIQWQRPKPSSSSKSQWHREPNTPFIKLYYSSTQTKATFTSSQSERADCHTPSDGPAEGPYAFDRAGCRAALARVPPLDRARAMASVSNNVTSSSKFQVPTPRI